MGSLRALKKPKVSAGQLFGPFFSGAARLACPRSGAFASAQVTRRIPLFLALACLAAVPARADTQADLSADTTTTDYATGETVARGNARLVDTGVLLTADEIRFNQKTQVASADGHVILTRVGDRLLADHLTYNRVSGKFTAAKLRIGRFPYYIEGATADGTLKEIVVHDATVTYGEPGRWQPTVKAKSLIYSPGKYLRLANGDIGIGNYLPLPISRLGQDLGKEANLADVTLDGGYRHTLGPYVDAEVHIPVVPGVTVGPDLGAYTFRGLMVGPIVNYDVTSGEDTAIGDVRSGYIHDFGTRTTDILDNPVPTNRAYIEWKHIQQISPELAVYGDINYSTDSEVIRDFHSKDFIPVQEPDNFLESVYTGGDFFASVFTRFQPDSFYPVQERLPELRFDLLPTPLGESGIYLRLDSDLAHLEENPPDGGAHLVSDRFDTFVGISRPFSFKGIVDFTPVAGARYTAYWNTSGALEPGGVGRALGEVGFDADMKLSGVFDYENPLWHIDGIRHLLTPVFSYRYIPNGDKDSAWIPPIDRSTFTTYLPPLELGDMRNVDQLQASNVLRVGLNNTLQTRDKTYGSRDLFTFNVADDFRFGRAPGQAHFSNVHTEMTVTPARWLEVHVEDSLAPDSVKQQAVDASVTVREADVWSATAGVGLLKDQIGTYYLPGLGDFPIVGLDTYHLEIRTRLNERYEMFARGDYDARQHLFPDQFYGVTQRVSNTWIVEYAVEFSSGPNKSGHFGLNVDLQLIRF